MKKLETKITRYQYGKYFVDIVETEEEFDAWLVGERGGLSWFMFGSMKDQPLMNPPRTETLESFLETVEYNLDDEIAFYEEEMLDIEEMHLAKMGY